MSAFFDIRTLIFISGSATVPIALLMFALARKQKLFPGYTEWACGTAAYSLGMILVSLRDILPDVFTVILANLLFLLYPLLIARGISRFSHLPQRLWLDFGLFVLIGGAFICLTYLFPDIRLRIIASSTGLFLLFLRCVWMIARLLPKEFPIRQKYLVPVFSAFATLFFLRSLFTLVLERPATDLMQTGLVQQLSIALVGVGVIFCTLLMIVIVFRRLQFELRKADNTIRQLSGFIPICSSCKKIRDDQGHWQPIEDYIAGRTKTQFTHGICPSCQEKIYPDQIRKHSHG